MDPEQAAEEIQKQETMIKELQGKLEESENREKQLKKDYASVSKRHSSVSISHT
jgi:hypothetical protein